MRASKLLLDTHVFLWWRSNDAKLKSRARNAISGADLVFVSAASAWEAAIKIALGRLKIPESMEAGVADSGFEKLAIGFLHAERVAQLPPHHSDPFDRMLIAQAQVEKLTFVTHDRRIQPYEIEIIWT